MKYRTVLALSIFIDLIGSAWTMYTWKYIGSTFFQLVYLNIFAFKAFFFAFLLMFSLFVPAFWRRKYPYKINSLLMITIVFIFFSAPLCKLFHKWPTDKLVTEAVEKYHRECLQGLYTNRSEIEQKALIKNYPYTDLNGDKSILFQFGKG